MKPDDRADFLNAIQDLVEQYGFDVGGYDDGGGWFEVILIPK